jgi:hypothetical protein
MGHGGRCGLARGFDLMLPSEFLATLPAWIHAAMAIYIVVMVCVPLWVLKKLLVGHPNKNKLGFFPVTRGNSWTAIAEAVG